MEVNNQGPVSFRGTEIPEIPIGSMMEDRIEAVGPQDIANKIMSMSPDVQESLTIDKIHYNQWGQISAVMLTSGDVVSIETAIALAGQNVLKGFTTGTTRAHGWVLKSHPDGDWENNLHSKPRF